jgi:hypothetical protein
MTTKKPKKKLEDPMKKSRELEEAELAGLRIDIEDEQKKKDSISWSNAELEKNVRSMEMNVIQLESGNLEADDSEIKLKYDNQRQLNIQLAEQKRWLEHELEQIKLKIQNEKMNPLPDPFALDWDALSETEMKRLVGQLEKTRNDLRSDLRSAFVSCVFTVLHFFGPLPEANEQIHVLCAVVRVAASFKGHTFIVPSFLLWKVRAKIT